MRYKSFATHQSGRPAPMSTDNVVEFLGMDDPRSSLLHMRAGKRMVAVAQEPFDDNTWTHVEKRPSSEVSSGLKEMIRLDIRMTGEPLDVSQFLGREDDEPHSREINPQSLPPSDPASEDEPESGTQAP